MKFAIDATPLLPGRKGVGLFLERAADHMSRRLFPEPPLVYVDKRFSEEAESRWPSLKFKPVWTKPSSLWEQYWLPSRVKKDQVSILLTGRDRTLLEPHCRTIVYLFEVPDYRQGALLNGNVRWYDKVSAGISRKRFRETTKSVTKFITSSFFTQKDLEVRYGVSTDRITTIYPGVDSSFRPASGDAMRLRARERFAKGYKYVLHFATGDVRDNTETALRAFHYAISSIPKDVHLLLAGVPKHKEAALYKEIEQCGLRSRASTIGYLSGNDLVMAYQGAEVYLDPTRYEGFGFQNLEAMACGIPVISSSVSSVPEVVGEAGLLFSPDDVSGFAQGLQEVLSDPKIVEKLREAGLKQAQKFTWEESMSRVLSVVEEEARKI